MDLPSTFTTVTPFSKASALALFIVLIIGSFFFGQYFERTSQVATTNPTVIKSNVTQVTLADKDKTISLKLGHQLKVVLEGSWAITDSSDMKILKMIGSPLITQDPNCSRLMLAEGGGCKTATATFATLNTGIATITATTTFCGEARLCRPDNLSYKLTVNVQ